MSPQISIKLALKIDKARPQIAQLSELGLVELTRKRQGKNVYELFSQCCPQCGGLGHLAHLPGESQLVALVESAATTPPPIPVPAPVTKPVEKPVEVNENGWDGSLEDEDGDNADQLELLHHPSYQEQNSNAGNRRRRRRPLTQPPNIVSKEDPPTKPVNNVETKEAEESNESENESRRERVPRHVRREEVPVERVSVEMTPVEQDIYALMGISPLVRVEQEFKDPKSVLVSVRSPEGFERKTIQKTPEKIEEPETAPPTEQQMTIDLTEIENTTSTESPPTEQEEETENLDENEVEANTAESSPEDEAKPVIRRRRRRSSAKDSDE